MGLRKQVPECPVCGDQFDPNRVDQLQSHINEHSARELLDSISPEEYLRLENTEQ